MLHLFYLDVVFAGAKVDMSTCGLVAMTSASHAEGRQFDPGQVYMSMSLVKAQGATRSSAQQPLGTSKAWLFSQHLPMQLSEASPSTVAILAQGTHRAVAPAQAYF